jgi:hypothetical protein
MNEIKGKWWLFNWENATNINHDNSNDNDILPPIF